MDSVSEPPDLKRTRRDRNGFKNKPTDRLPPHSPESEQGVLGSVFLDSKVAMPECIAALKSGSQMFYDLRHQTIYQVLVEMFEARENIEIITVVQKLRNKQQLEEVGGLAYLTQLPDLSAGAINVTYYLPIIVEKHLLRTLIQTCTEAVCRVYEHEGEVESLFDKFERDVLAIRTGNQASTYTSMKELIPQAIQRIEDHLGSKHTLLGIGTGLPDLDKMTGGLKNKDMIVIAARPSMGKTSLATQIAEHVAVNCKLPVGIFSLETSEESLTDRMLCARARVNSRNIQEGFVADEEFRKLTGAAGKLAASGIYIDDERGMSIGTLRAKARRMQQAKGIKLLVIDYLQLLCATINGKKQIENRQQEIAAISGGIKSLAGDLNIPVIVLSQLSRDLEKAKGRKPMLSDLRESGAIEQDADLVGMLYKVNDDEDEEDQYAIRTNLLIAKQRNGPTGDVHLVFLKSWTRFESCSRVGDQDVPESSQGSFI